MMQRNIDKNRQTMRVISIDDLVPKDHLLRLIDKAINFDFIYDLVEDKYSHDNGRPSIDPIMLIKIPLLQYLFGIKSMRQTVKEIDVNMAYKWFLGLEIDDPAPHFTTFGKNYSRRFKNTDLFEQIFEQILAQCFKYDFVDPTVTFVDATHIKASANKRKAVKHTAKKEALFYQESLIKEVEGDRKSHGKKPLKDKKKDDDNDSSGGMTKQIALSEIDPESGMFHKGEHKKEFAYVSQTACDINGWILGFTIHPGNEHDSRTFPAIYEKIKALGATTIVADAGYKTPALAKLMIDDGIIPVLPYKRPMTKKGFFRKYEYAYDEYYDCYICPNNEILKYSTTNREGYREYKSNGKVCIGCPYLSQCTLSQNHVKVVIRHVWEEYMEKCEDIRHDRMYKEIYKHRKETIERVFGTAKEHHGMRYTTCRGKAQMRMKVGLTFACMNMKKLAMMLHRKGLLDPNGGPSFQFFQKFNLNNLKKQVWKSFPIPALSSL